MKFLKMWVMMLVAVCLCICASLGTFFLALFAANCVSKYFGDTAGVAVFGFICVAVIAAVLAAGQEQ